MHVKFAQSGEGAAMATELEELLDFLSSPSPPGRICVLVSN
ncbi:hypothetical protein Pint_22751 [Pistacia integerrima]|uniref:Uncharacterized protein n=1 Tax=Pistacia integerrima TaxID=434235 RepID=A0ACC0YJ73_9ROSI|nr:hypothetical protein Pint_22751 [Pistacia integerrima]